MMTYDMQINIWLNICPQICIVSSRSRLVLCSGIKFETVKGYYHHVNHKYKKDNQLHVMKMKLNAK